MARNRSYSLISGKFRSYVAIWLMKILTTQNSTSYDRCEKRKGLKTEYKTIAWGKIRKLFLLERIILNKDVLTQRNSKQNIINSKTEKNFLKDLILNGNLDYD